MPDGRPSILIVDDDPALRKQLEWLLGDGHALRSAGDRESALAALRADSFAAVVLDLHLTPEGGDAQGLEILRAASHLAPQTRVILLTGETDPRMARETLRWGAWDYQAKPVDPEELQRAIGRALRLSRIEDEARAASGPLERLGPLSTVNAEMAEVLRAARALAATPLPLLIVGPAGCGKTRFAREIHALAAGGSVLREAEEGTLPDGDLAAGETWLLEQVERLPATLQARLAGQMSAGSDHGRVLATARMDPHDRARRGRFQPELARRLETARLEIPPLSARLEDLPQLLTATLEAWSADRGRPAPRLTPSAEARLAELARAAEVGEIVERVRDAAERAEGPWIDIEAIGEVRRRRPEPLRTQRARLEAALVREALTRWKGNVSGAARELGVSRPTLHDLMRKHALDPSRFRRG